MNRVIASGIVGRDPEIKYGGANNTCIARYSLAVKRRYAKEGEQDTDWFNLVAFGKVGEFAEKHIRKGTKLIVEGHLQTGSYTNKDGQKVYTTDLVVESQEFAESKKSAESSGSQHVEATQAQLDDFMNIADADELAEELPFK